MDKKELETELRTLCAMISTMWADDSTHDDLQEYANELKKRLDDENL